MTATTKNGSARGPGRGSARLPMNLGAPASRRHHPETCRPDRGGPSIARWFKGSMRELFWKILAPNIPGVLRLSGLSVSAATVFPAEKLETANRKPETHKPVKTFIALLRGINVGGHKTVPMSQLRLLCGKLGWRDVRTYIQSGNIVFSASGKTATLQTQLEHAIEGHFHFPVSVIVRVASDWPAYIKSNPFLDACKNDSKLVMLCLSKAAPNPDAAKTLRERAASGERIEQIGDALWIHFAGGVARSKLSPALLDRAAGSPITARNWLTVLKLQELATTPTG